MILISEIIYSIYQLWATQCF